MDKFLVCNKCTQERDLQIKLEEKRDVEKFVNYVESYFKKTPSDEQKGIRELHEKFKKKHINAKNFSPRFVLHVYLQAQKWSSFHH